GSPEIVQVLIAAGARVNVVVHGETPLHRAAAANRPDLVQVLLDASADVHARIANPEDEENGMTPLEVAKSRKARKVIPVLEVAAGGKAQAAKVVKAKAVPAVADSWKRIEAWLKAHNPKLGKALNKGASAKEFAKVEAKLGVKFPADFKESYQLHDGQNEGD